MKFAIIAFALTLCVAGALATAPPAPIAPVEPPRLSPEEESARIAEESEQTPGSNYKEGADLKKAAAAVNKVAQDIAALEAKFAEAKAMILGVRQHTLLTQLKADLHAAEEAGLKYDQYLHAQVHQLEALSETFGGYLETALSNPVVGSDQYQITAIGIHNYIANIYRSSFAETAQKATAAAQAQYTAAWKKAAADAAAAAKAAAGQTAAPATENAEL
eukprot:TRINITY_DN849_c0_g1_i1.p1 TRINITY_DN849_c0_g1~~TRINITY_DN849_c0_g1_i1.p1  ORF type:complete len:218 (-),score=95.64 TRINITY_DN849_c0_g1_i1:297-950(-)